VRAFAIFVVLVCTLRGRQGNWPTLLVLASLAVLATLQLFPLPAAIWSNMAINADIRDFDELVFAELPSRPVTRSPSATMNALFALSVPFAAWAAMNNVRSDNQMRILLWSILGFTVVAALVGFAQVATGADSNLYFYDITNRGQAVGFFANRNHHAVFLGCGLAIAIYLTREASTAKQTMSATWLPLALAVVLALAIIANASRAGLLVLVVVLGSVSAFALTRSLLYARKKRAKSPGRSLIAPILAITAGISAFATFWALERSPAMQRLLGADPSGDLRARVLPDLWAMAGDFFPQGAGLGAFEYAYRSYETRELFTFAYVNNAHNDWLQFLIEGGVGAIVILALTAGIVLKPLVQTWRTSRALSPRSALGLSIIAIIALASLVDYPLRTPAFMVLGVVALALLAHRDLTSSESLNAQRKADMVP
jgi:O-antigen ligase